MGLWTTECPLNVMNTQRECSARVLLVLMDLEAALFALRPLPGDSMALIAASRLTAANYVSLIIAG